MTRVRWQTMQEKGRRRATTEYLCTNKQSSHCNVNINKSYCSNDSNKWKHNPFSSEDDCLPIHFSQRSRYSISLNRFSRPDHDSLNWALFQNEIAQERTPLITTEPQHQAKHRAFPSGRDIIIPFYFGTSRWEVIISYAPIFLPSFSNWL